MDVFSDETFEEGEVELGVYLAQLAAGEAI